MNIDITLANRLVQEELNRYNTPPTASGVAHLSPRQYRLRLKHNALKRAALRYLPEASIGGSWRLRTITYDIFSGPHHGVLPGTTVRRKVFDKGRDYDRCHAAVLKTLHREYLGDMLPS